MTTLTGADFNEQIIYSSQPALVVFGADWCGSCRMLSPEIKALYELHQGQALIARVNVDQEAQLAKLYQVNHIPTLLFFRNGLVVNRHTGAIPLAALAQKLSLAVI